MNNRRVANVHWSFWAIAVVGLIWNVMGIVNFFVQMNPDMIETYRETERAIIEGRPVWATAGFALSVFGGAIGCLLLLLKKSAAFYLFCASLVGTIVTMIHTLGTGAAFGLGEMIGIILMPLVVAAFLTWYSKLAEGKGWIS